jgi:uncharacterized protein
VFVDTGAFLARNARRDPYSDAATQIWNDLEHTPLLTTNHVIEETLTLLARRLGNALAADMADRVYSSAALEIVYTSRKDDVNALRYFRKFADQRVSFTDCISFAVMRRRGLDTAFTFDRHFLHAGFRVMGAP